MLNAVLALRLRQHGWPPVLADCGYAISGVGVTFKLPDGVRVVPDVLASAASRQVTLLAEIKGGPSVDLSQLGRMEKVTPEDLRDFAHLRIDDPAAHRVAIVYLCNEEHRPVLAAAVEDRATVVGFDGTRFALAGRPLVDPDLGDRLLAAEVAPGATAPAAAAPARG